MLSRVRYYFGLGVILWGALASISYFATGAGWGPLADIRNRPSVFWASSPLPLVFDRREYFYLAEVKAEHESGEVSTVKVDHELISTLPWVPHRRMTWGRIFFNFEILPMFYWQAMARHRLCVEDMLSVQRAKGKVDHFHLRDVYAPGTSREKAVSVMISCHGLAPAAVQR